MPAQVVDQRGALRDESLAVIDEQPDVERARRPAARPGSVSRPSRSAARAIATASIESDLPRSRADAARAGHELRRDAHDALAAREQEPLQRAGDVPAVLDRPHPLARRAPRAQRSSSSKLAACAPAPSARRARAPVAASTAAHVCERLCVSAPITIIRTVPSFGY